MKKKFFPSLFATIMLGMIMPLFPFLLQSNQSSQQEARQDAGPLSASVQISSFITQGYVGAPTRMPEASAQALAEPSVNNAVSERTAPLKAAIAPEPREPAKTTPLQEARVAGSQESTVRIAAASRALPYEALEVARSSDAVMINPGQAVTLWVDFKNVGTATWNNRGANFIALNVTNPAGRSSVFRHSYWGADYRAGRMTPSQVRPGEVGRIRFAIQAPQETGVYEESFHLVAEHLTWITGGKTTFTIGVGQRPTYPQHWKATETARSASGTVHIDPGKALTFSVDYRNDGSVPWFSSGNNFVALNVTNPVGRSSIFRHGTWKAAYRPAQLTQPFVRPGETAQFRFAIQAPQQEGIYTETFQLVAEGLTWIDGSTITVLIQVGNPVVQETAIPLAGEPVIRVGLFTTTAPVTITSTGGYTVSDSGGTRATRAAAESTQITSTGGTYSVSSGESWQSSSPIRITPQGDNGIVEITSYENRPSWNTLLNDNTFRGVIEVRYVTSTNTTWVINELPLESYLRGVAETSNELPAEYLKAMAIAERSYTLWHYLAGGKYSSEQFTVNATTDQVYRGYGYESRSIDPRAAVIATAGKVLTHPDAVSIRNTRGIIVTPYSSGTDGRTRNWSEVWQGSFSWLQSVDDPYGIIPDALTRSGNHMVGMSAKGALGYATNGSTAESILTHFYTGTHLESAY